MEPIDNLLSRTLNLGPLAHYLSMASRLGHIACSPPHTPSVSSLLEELEFEMEDFTDSLMEEIKHFTSHPYIVRKGEWFYFKKNYIAETLLVDEIKRLREETPHITCSLDRVDQLPLLPGQRDVVCEALNHTLSLIVGGPGTGKTYTAGWLIRMLIEEAKTPFSVVLAAPTGKAAIHLKQSIEKATEGLSLPPMEMMTLHALIGKKREGLFPQDVILIDEASMVDIHLMPQLLARVKPGARLILMGDPNQLPPVEGGTLFTDLADVFQGGVLTESRRVENPTLLEWAHGVKEGVALFPLKPLKAFNHSSSIILTPLKEGFYGVDALNHQKLHSFLEKPPKILEIPIMITRNDYTLGLFNGECGTLIASQKDLIDLREKRRHFRSFQESFVKIMIDGKERTFLPYELPPFQLAWAISVHKSQGSEFDHVSLLIPPGSKRFGRELLYTAITRAKKRLEVFGDLDELNALLKKTYRRSSALVNRI
ncbi:AAA family ATPase [Chlamydiales bacterium]|nr:AAA family ATPase [Chlamydiales bacterium]